MATDPTKNSSSLRLRAGVRIAAIVSRYHGELTGAMLDSARAELEAAGLAPECLVELAAPGAFELPVIASELARREDIDAVLCFGLVLKGETEHDRHIARAVAHGLIEIGLRERKPVLFGVLTCNTIEQARARALSPADGGQHDKGREVAKAAVEALGALDLARDLPTAGTRFSRTGDNGPLTDIALAPVHPPSPEGAAEAADPS
jgi:6,7-dimethyl-8-ribityllumazine synthase